LPSQSVLAASCTEGIVDAGLTLAGAKGVRPVWDKPVPAGTAHAVPIPKLQREIVRR
jgi:hypothetical protein